MGSFCSTATCNGCAIRPSILDSRFRRATFIRRSDAAAARYDIPWRVRFLLSREGGVHVEHSPLQPSCPPLRIALAAGPIDQDDVFLFHKTTNRTV